MRIVVGLIVLIGALTGLHMWTRVLPSHSHFAIWCLMATLLVATATFLSPTGRLQNAMLAATSIIATFTALEAGMLVHVFGPPEVMMRIYGEGPRRGPAQVHTDKVVDGQLSHDVVYGYDAEGHRRVKGNTEGGCTILFFGDSFVFGQGLEDDETLAQQFLLATGSRYDAVNFAAPGHGPHHTLRELETMPADRRFTGQVGGVFTTLLVDHGRRARGLLPWAHIGPRYELTPDEQLVSAGQLGTFSPQFVSWPATRRMLLSVLRRSTVFDRLYGYPELADEEEKKFTDTLVVAILARVDAIVRERFAVRLTVIAWDDGLGHIGPILEDLRRHGVDAMDKDTLLFAGHSSPDDFIPNDGHPSAKAIGEIAASLAKRFSGCPG